MTRMLETFPSGLHNGAGSGSEAGESIDTEGHRDGLRRRKHMLELDMTKAIVPAKISQWILRQGAETLNRALTQLFSKATTQGTAPRKRLEYRCHLPSDHHVYIIQDEGRTVSGSSV